MKKTLSILMILSLLALPVRALAETGAVWLSDDATAANARLAAEKISGVTLAFGESFSFNETVGPRTEDTGFVSALNGRGVEVVGGGCAQAASALYLALSSLAPGSVSFDELSFYGDRYSGSYVANGSQAVLVDYKNGRDLRFTNICAGALTIAMSAQDEQLVCTVSVGDMPAATMMPAMYHEPVHLDSVEIDCGADSAVLQNVVTAAASVNDTMLSSGDVFSFNEVVGLREEAFGYVSATNGRGVEVVGGGCAQVASALWLLIQDDPDFVIIAKSTYGSKYNQAYVDSSSDAILVDYSAGTDFTFRYVGTRTVTLYASVTDGHLTVGRG